MAAPKANVRQEAIGVLERCWRERCSVDPLLAAAQARLNDHRDRQLTAAIVRGVLRRLRGLDWVLARFSKHPLAKMRPLPLSALRAGVFQLLYMDRLPAAAVVNETVKALRVKRQPRWLTGFVNGLLRRVAREREEVMAALDEAPLGVRLNHPDWLVERWRRRYGEEGVRRICAANAGEAELCLHINGSAAAYHERLRAAGIEAAAGRYLPTCLRLPAYRGPVAALPGYDDGAFFVQDEAAQLLTCLFSPIEGPVLDACAGVGGKTAALARRFGAGAVTAVEPHAGRSSLLGENLRRLGLEGVRVERTAIADFAAAKEGRDFAAVLVDAPCSGLGVTGRHPDIRWNREAADIPRYQERQRAILTAAAALVRPGGELVYATCSTEPEENEAVVSAFLQREGDFMVVEAATRLPETARPLVDESGFLRTVPGPEMSDGFFAALLTRRL